LQTEKTREKMAVFEREIQGFFVGFFCLETGRALRLRQSGETAGSNMARDKKFEEK